MLNIKLKTAEKVQRFYYDQFHQLSFLGLLVPCALFHLLKV